MLGGSSPLARIDKGSFRTTERRFASHRPSVFTCQPSRTCPSVILHTSRTPTSCLMLQRPIFVVGFGPIAFHVVKSYHSVALASYPVDLLELNFMFLKCSLRRRHRYQKVLEVTTKYVILRTVLSSFCFCMSTMLLAYFVQSVSHHCEQWEVIIMIDH